MTKPLVSIVLPIYNHETFVEDALVSIKCQSYRPLELIAIDDGSSDNSAVVAKDFIQRQIPWGKFLTRDNKGAAFTINEAIKISSGKYINVLNSDDMFDLGRIDKCVTAAEVLGHDLIYGMTEYIKSDLDNDQDDELIQGWLRAEEDAHQYPSVGFALLKNQLAISTGNLFMSRNLYDRVGQFNDYKYVHDWDFVLRSLFYAEPYVIKQPLYKYRLHGLNSFKNLQSAAGYETCEVMRNFLSTMINRLPENNRAPSPHYWPLIFDIFISRLQYNQYLPPEYRQKK